MRGAYIAGAAARRKGLPIEANPYGDARRPDGGATYARGFHDAWLHGWEDQGGPNPVFPPA